MLHALDFLRFPKRQLGGQAESYELVAEEAVKQLGLDLTGVGKPSREGLDGFGQFDLDEDMNGKESGEVYEYDIVSQNRWIDRG